LALEIASEIPSTLPHMPSEITSNHNFILKVLRSNGEALKYAAGWHRNAEAALTAIQRDPQAIHYVETELYERPEFAQAVVEVNPWAFEQFDVRLRGDFDLALFAARSEPGLALFAGLSIRDAVLRTVKEEQSAISGAPAGYVDGPVWWTPFSSLAAQEKK